MRSIVLSAALLLGSASLASAGPDDFGPGQLIPGYGRIAPVPQAAPLPADTHFKLAIDVVDGGEDGEVNRRFVTAASFLNLQHAAGIPVANIDIALVVHGPAYRDLLTDAAYGGSNPNAELIDILRGHGVRFLYCGQSAVYRDVGADDLLPGIELSPSATTAHVLLQQQGYALRP